MLGIDWERLLEEARARSFIYILQHAFQAMDEVLEVAIPEGFRERLADSPVALRERLEYSVRRRDKNYKFTLIGRWCQLSRYYPERGFCWKVLNFPSFLTKVWHVRRYRDLVPYLFRVSFLYGWRHLSGKRSDDDDGSRRS